MWDSVDSLAFSKEAQAYGHKSTPLKVVKDAYGHFATGDMESFSMLLHPKMKFESSNPEDMPCGKKGGYIGFEAWAEGCLSKIGDTWPGFRMTNEHFITEGAYVFVTNRAQNDAGMDTKFGHRFKVVA